MSKRNNKDYKNKALLPNKMSYSSKFSKDTIEHLSEDAIIHDPKTSTHVQLQTIQQSQYTLQRQEKSYCPECGKNVYLLANYFADSSSFYICFDCKFVGHIGEEGVLFVEK